MEQSLGKRLPSVQLRLCHAVSTRSAAILGSSHSQTQITSHPASSNSRRWRSSRNRFASSFAAHHAAFAFGRVPCAGHECQKSPMTKTAILTRVKTTSGLDFPTFRCSRKRIPRACKARRNLTSGAVPEVRWAVIWRRTVSLVAAGRTLTQPFSYVGTTW